MATRVEKILTNARRMLADPTAQRWDDDTLIAILNEAQIDFVQQTQMLNERVTVPIFLDTPFFPLPDDCLQLTRVLYRDVSLPLVTHNELDSTYNNKFASAATNWELSTGEPKAVIYDRRNSTEGKLYPIPNTPLLKELYTYDSEGMIITRDVPIYSHETYNINNYGVVALFEGVTLMQANGVVAGPTNPTYAYTHLGVTTGATTTNDSLFGCTTSISGADSIDRFGVLCDLLDDTQDTEIIGYYGILTEFIETTEVDSEDDNLGVIIAAEDYEVVGDFGVISTIEDEFTPLEHVFGVVSEVEESSSSVICYYLSQPKDLVDISSELTIPQQYDTALKFYVCGQAFMLDNDAGFQQKGAAQLQVYERHLKNAKKDSLRDFSRAAQFETLYRRGF